MLPDIPKTKRELQHQLTLTMRRYAETQMPLLQRVRHLVQHEGTMHHYERFDAPPVTEGPESHVAKLEILADEVPMLVGEKLFEKIKGTTDEMVASLNRMAISKLEQVTKEVGNVVDAKGQPFSQEMYLEMLEKVLIDFDDRGNPTTTFHAPPSIGPMVRDKMNEWQRDPAFRERAGAIWRRKLCEWHDRESDRKLAD